MLPIKGAYFYLLTFKKVKNIMNIKVIFLGTVILGIILATSYETTSYASIDSRSQATSKDADYYIDLYADMFKINRCLAHAVINIESGKLHTTKAGKLTKSKAGAKGIGQVTERTKKDLQINADLSSLEDNIFASMKILDNKLKTVASKLNKLQKLKANDNGVRRYNGFNNSEENLLYTAKVINNLARCNN